MSSHDQTARWGRFTLPEHWVRKEGLNLLPLMSRVVVFDCRLDQSVRKFVYLAMSPDFDAIDEGEPAPAYEWRIQTHLGKITKVEAERLV